jgi:hypothetical protein
MTFADLSEAFWIVLPLVAATVLLGFGVVGSFLPQDTRIAIEHWVLGPAFVVAMACWTILGGMDGRWLAAAIGLAGTVLGAFRLTKNIRNHRAAKALTNPSGTGTTA